MRIRLLTGGYGLRKDGRTKLVLPQDGWFDVSKEEGSRLILSGVAEADPEEKAGGAAAAEAPEEEQTGETIAESPAASMVPDEAADGETPAKKKGKHG